MQTTFLWGNKGAKIKHDTLCNNFTEGGLKNVDIKHKISALNVLGYKGYTLRTFTNGN